MVIGVRQLGVVGAALAHVIVIGAFVLPAYLAALKRVTGVSLHRLAVALATPLATSALATLAALSAITVTNDPLLQLIAGGAAGGAVYLLTAGPFVAPMLISRRVPGVDRMTFAYGYLARILPRFAPSLNLDPAQFGRPERPPASPRQPQGRHLSAQADRTYRRSLFRHSMGRHRAGRYSDFHR